MIALFGGKPRTRTTARLCRSLQSGIGFEQAHLEWLLLITAALVVFGCGPRSESSRTASTPPRIIETPDPWRLTCHDPNASEPALLWNGMIGIRIARDGTGTGSDGKPLGFFSIFAYEKTGEEKILTLRNPLTGSWTAVVSGKEVPLRPGSNYSQILDMRTGELDTSWDQDGISVKIADLIHPTKPTLAERVTVSSLKAATLQFRSTLPQLAAASGTAGDQLHLKFQINGEASPLFMEGVIRSSTGARWQLTPQMLTATAGLSTNRPVTFERVYGFPDERVSHGTTQRPDTVEAISRISRDFWSKRWNTDIQIDGPVADQQAVRSFLFYLQSAVQPGCNMSISPFGLSNAQYNGHVFWDADIWVFPSLALVAPNLAKQVADYRTATFPQATLAFAKLKPNDQSGAIYPWESSVSGKDVTPTVSRRELHISGDVAWMIHQAASLGLDPRDAKPLLNDIAKAYLLRSIPKDGKRELENVMSPDENHVGNNDLYTNLLAQWVVNGEKWNAPKISFKIPRDSTSLLTYDNDSVRGYKQAAAVLAIYPLQYPEAEREAKVMMERFEPKVTPNGPAMTGSVDALIWARLGYKKQAYETWEKSWQDYTRSPLMLFSEKRSRPVTYFTTGAAGCLQTVLYGFLGFRLDSQKEPGSTWSMKLLGDSWLSVKPNLPTEWKSVKFKNFTVLGRHYTLTASPTAAQVTEGE